MDLRESLRSDIAAGHAFVVVGTGVSSGATRLSKASWFGLLTSGLERAAALGQMDRPTEQRCREMLKTSGSSDDFLWVAGKVVAALGGAAAGEFASWMREDVGYLSPKIVDNSVIKAIGNLNLRILTTNYDDLLETVLARPYITWLQKGETQRLIGHTSDDILHLHGHWKHPESIILTAQQYEAMLADEEVRALRQALATVNTMIYIGFGAGLDDPNFSRLRTWITKTLPFQQLRHYRLCKEDDLTSLQDAHHGESIWPVSYGSRHEDLAPFLSDMAPQVTTAGAAYHANAFEIIEDKVRESAVLNLHISNPDTARISDLLVPPVLLPVPNDQFVALDRSDNPVRPGRCDLSEEILSTHMLLTGEEHVGVTSSLLWMCAEMYLRDSAPTPLLVDFLTLGSGPTPLRKQVVKQLRQMGHQIRESDELPRLLLVLDNVSAINTVKLARVAKEMDEPAFERVLLGCRTGNESIIAEALKGSKHPYSLRYVGRLAKRDLRGLANLVNHVRADELTDQAARVVRQHSLPSTPFTLSMILSALLRGESLMSASSPTSLLDAYVDLLLGRGTQADDSRFGLDAANKSHVLSRLAEEFVQRRLGH